MLIHHWFERDEGWCVIVDSCVHWLMEHEKTIVWRIIASTKRIVYPKKSMHLAHMVTSRKKKSVIVDS